MCFELRAEKQRRRGSMDNASGWKMMVVPVPLQGGERWRAVVEGRMEDYPCRYGDGQYQEDEPLHDHFLRNPEFCAETPTRFCAET